MEFVEQSDSMTQALRDYKESRVLSARPVEIVEMLYQVAIDNLRAAIRHLKTGEALERANAVSKAQEAVNELMLALDHSVGASFTHTLAALYAYVQHQVIVGHASQSEVAFEKAISILSTLLEGWVGVREKTIASELPAVEPVARPQAEPFVEASQPLSDRSGEYYQEVPAGSRDWNC
jgi:flagellar biosynthetic protein FliS